MPPRSDDSIGALEQARKRLYTPTPATPVRSTLSGGSEREVPRAWGEHLRAEIPHPAKRPVRLATIFLGIAVTFFVVSLAAAGYFFYFGGNSVSVDKVKITLEGPTTIAGGDTVPFSLSITNRNPVAIENAKIEITFPSGTLAADGSYNPYPRFIEDLGTLKSGETVTRSIKAIVFGAAGQALLLPVSLSFGTGGSAADFLTEDTYALAISSTPLSISVDALSETVSGKPLTFTIAVRSNTSVPIDNVVITSASPFGFTVTESSRTMKGQNIALGTLAPGATKTVTITGVLTGEDGDERVFRFTVGTAKEGSDAPVVYMTQEAAVAITAPFIATTLAINGNAGTNVILSPESYQTVTLQYANTLSTSITNATIEVAVSGSAVDYDSIETTNGFYRSSDRTIVFSRDTDPSLGTLAPGDSGIGTFTFSTVKAAALTVAPSVTFTLSVSGIRVGQANVPEKVSATITKTVKVATALVLSARSLYASGPFTNSGPIPPKADQATTYTIVWDITNRGNAVAGGTVVATLPSYVSYLNKTSGTGSFSYNEKSRTLSWNTGDLSQNANAVGVFQVSLTPSSSQKGSRPELTGTPTFTGYDRFAGVEVKATTKPSTTETENDPGYSSGDGTVQ